MSFFEPREPQPPVDPSPQPYVPPIWTGPSQLVLGGVAPIEALLVTTDSVAITLDNFRCYPNGFSVNLGFQLRPTAENVEDRMLGRRHGGSLPRIGLEFADGRKTGHHGGGFFDVPKDGDGIPTEPVIHMLGGGGGGDRWDQRLWVWPLPPRGPLTVYFEWSERGILESKQVVDGDLIVDAAERSIQLWDTGEVAPHPFTGRSFGGGSTRMLVGRVAEELRKEDDS
jgi:hypothetical protein